MLRIATNVIEINHFHQVADGIIMHNCFTGVCITCILCVYNIFSCVNCQVIVVTIVFW